MIQWCSVYEQNCAYALPFSQNFSHFQNHEQVFVGKKILIFTQQTFIEQCYKGSTKLSPVGSLKK